MYYILFELCTAAAIIAVIFLLLWKVFFHSFQKTVLYAVFAVYLSAVYHLVGLPTVQFFTFDINLNLIPFAGMIADLKNEILNTVLFIPLGFLLPLLWKKYRSMKNTLSFGLGMTMTIEILQLFTYRATDINDVIMNTIGTWIGYLFFRVIQNKAPRVLQENNKATDIFLIFGIATAVMFFIQPLIVSYIYRIT